MNKGMNEFHDGGSNVVKVALTTSHWPALLNVVYLFSLNSDRVCGRYIKSI